VPRGHLGLAYDESTEQLLGVNADEQGGARLMARVSELSVGPPSSDPDAWTRPFPITWGSGPEHVGRADVARLGSILAQLRALDDRYGGGACREAVLAQLGWANQLLRAQPADDAVTALHVTVADLHLLAGWTSFDLGALGPARRHYARAVEHARFVDEPSVVAATMYRLARLHMQRGWPGQAVRLLHLGQVSAQQSGLSRAASLLHANLAWAYAMLGDGHKVGTELDRARDEYGRGDGETVPPWLEFFDEAELAGLRGATLAYFEGRSPQQRAEAIERSSLSLALRDLSKARSRAFDLILLSWMMLENGDKDEALRAGNEAVDQAAHIQSERVIDRFAPLRACLDRYQSDSELSDLAERIRMLAKNARRGSHADAG
jgi:hypothetical protein